MNYKNKYYKYKKKYLNLKQHAGSSTQNKILQYIEKFNTRIEKEKKLNNIIEFKGLIILGHGAFIKDTNLEKKYKYILPFGDFKGKVLMINHERLQILSDLLKQNNCESLNLDSIKNTIYNTINNLKIGCSKHYQSLLEKELKNIKQKTVLQDTTNIIKDINSSDKYKNKIEELEKKLSEYSPEKTQNLFKYSPEHPQRIYELYQPLLIDSNSEYIMNNMMFQFDLKGDGIYIVYCINDKIYIDFIINTDVIPNLNENITLLDLKTMFNKLLKEGESFIMPITCTNYLN